MYHIVAPKRHRQYGAIRRNYYPAQVFALCVESDAKGLIELPIAVFGRVRGMEQQSQLATPGGFADAVAASGALGLAIADDGLWFGVMKHVSGELWSATRGRDG